MNYLLATDFELWHDFIHLWIDVEWGNHQKYGRNDGMVIEKPSGRLAVGGLLGMDGTHPIWSCCQAFPAGPFLVYSFQK